MLMASSSSIIEAFAAMRFCSKRNFAQNRCTFPTNTLLADSSAICTLMRSVIPRAARLVKVKQSISSLQTPCERAFLMRSVSICVLPHPGGASTKWQPWAMSITACWSTSGIKTEDLSCVSEGLSCCIGIAKKEPCVYGWQRMLRQTHGFEKEITQKPLRRRMPDSGNRVREGLSHSKTKSAVWATCRRIYRSWRELFAHRTNRWCA